MPMMPGSVTTHPETWPRIGAGATTRASTVALHGSGADTEGMCRSIQTLRPPFHAEPTSDEIRAAALQYVRKISGFRTPAAHNAAAFEAAVDAVTVATAQLLDELVVRGSTPAAP